MTENQSCPGWWFSPRDAEPGHGGSGYRKLEEAGLNIVAVVSNHPSGGVHDIAQKHGRRFIHMPKPYTAEAYQAIVAQAGADFVALSGWIKPVHGLDPSRTFNIHPALLPRFDGKGFYGLKPHEEVLKAFEAGEITETAVCMHFVTEKYDDGPVFFQFPVPLVPGVTAQMIQKLVNFYEHRWQARITNLVIQGVIAWDGVSGHPVEVPPWYKAMPICPDSCVERRKPV